MHKIQSSRRVIAVVAVLLAGGVVASAVVAGQFGAATVPRDLEAAIESEPLRRVADIPAEGELARRGVFVQQTSVGYVCLWEAATADSLDRRGGCNSTEDPFGGNELSASFAYDGGPTLETVRDARLFGLASPDVARVEILMSDGTMRHVALRGAPVDGVRFRAYGYRVRPSDLRRSVTPVAVLGKDLAGNEIGRRATGFGG